MIRQMLARLLNLQPPEMRSIAFLWLLYLLFSAATQLGDGVNQVLFLKRVGVGYLPHMFVVKAVLDVVVAVLYVPLAAHLGHPRTLSLLLALGGLGVLILWIPAGSGLPLAYPVLYGFIEALSTLLKIHWGVLLLDHFSEEAARRVFPLIYTGARLGAITGGVMLSALARPLRAPNLLLLTGGLYLVSGGLSLGIKRTDDSPARDMAREAAAGRIIHLKQGLSVGFGQPLLKSIALATAAMVLCRYGLRYLYSESFAASFDEVGLASFYGVYIALANGGSIVLQVLVTPRLLMHVGVTLTNLIYALGILAVYLGIGLWPGLLTAVVARLMETELKAAVKTPLSNLFYGAIPAAQRAAGRAFILGLVVPLFTLVASAVLATPAGVRSIPWWGAALAVLFVAASLLQNRSYRQARGAKS